MVVAVQTDVVLAHSGNHVSATTALPQTCLLADDAHRCNDAFGCQHFPNVTRYVIRLRMNQVLYIKDHINVHE
jgi:hypothetical protein